MDSQQIKAFIDAMAASDLDEMEVSHDGWTLRLTRRGAGQGSVRPLARAASAPLTTAAAASAAAAESSLTASVPTEVRAPLFGVVHLQQGLGEPAFVQVGQRFEAGQMLCVIEAMKVFNEVRAEQAGSVAAILVASGQEVEAGQPLLRFA
jgi:acetyl-CoA carboxylase biotin carboxyl carrier protein